MNLQEAALHTIMDNFIGMLMIPIQGRTAVYVIRIFESYPFLIIALCAIVGSLIATFANWYLGRFIASAFSLKAEGEKRIHRFFNKCRKYWYLNVFLAAIPFLGPLLNGLAGIAKIEKKYVLLGAVISNGVYYGLFFTTSLFIVLMK